MDRGLLEELVRAVLWLRNLFRKSSTKARRLRDSVQFPINSQFSSSFMDHLPKAVRKALREVVVWIRRLIAPALMERGPRLGAELMVATAKSVQFSSPLQLGNWNIAGLVLAPNVNLSTIENLFGRDGIWTVRKGRADSVLDVIEEDEILLDEGHWQFGIGKINQEDDMDWLWLSPSGWDI